MLAETWKIIEELVTVDEGTKEFLSPFLFEGKRESQKELIKPLFRQVRDESVLEDAYNRIFVSILEETKQRVEIQQKHDLDINTTNLIQNDVAKHESAFVKINDWKVFNVRIGHKMVGKRKIKTLITGQPVKQGQVLFLERPLLYLPNLPDLSPMLGPLRLHQTFMNLNKAKKEMVKVFPPLPNCNRKKQIQQMMGDTRKRLAKRVPAAIFDEIEEILLLFDHKAIELIHFKNSNISSANTGDEVNNTTFKKEEAKEDADDEEEGEEYSCCGKGLYRLVSWINHSCIPNVYINVVNNNDGLIEIRALRDLEIGEELVISWLTFEYAMETIHNRNKQLLQRFGMVCRCDLCRNPDKSRCLVCPVENCRSNLLATPPYKNWQCIKCETKFKHTEIAVLIQRENELSLCSKGLNITLKEGKIKKSTFEKEITQALHKSVNILGSTHYARPLLHLMAAEWFKLEGKIYESAMHFIEYTRIYEDIYGHIPNPRIALIMQSVAEQVGDQEHKLHYIRNAIWGFVNCLGENHGCTTKALEILNTIEEKMKNETTNTTIVEEEKSEKKKKTAHVIKPKKRSSD